MTSYGSSAGPWEVLPSACILGNFRLAISDGHRCTGSGKRCVWVPIRCVRAILGIFIVTYAYRCVNMLVYKRSLFMSVVV